MSFRAKILVGAFCIVAAFIGFKLARVYGRRPAEKTNDAAAKNDDARTAAPTNSVSSSTPSRSPDSGQTVAVKRLLDKIAATLTALKNGAAGTGLEDLKAEFAKADPRVAIAAIGEFLKTGQDASTGAVFEVGEGGALDGAPTLRVFLLDQHGQLAKLGDPSESATIARDILSTKTSPDEWAIALRNVAWADSTSSGFLAGKMREMLGYAPWRSSPGSGMHEAFDVIAYTKDTSFIPDLEAMIGGENLELQRAAAVALDRLAETSPTALMNYLNSNPALFSDRPLLRADYFAKADLGDGAQRQLFENYLARTDASFDEKSKAIDELIEPGTFVSENLLTTVVDKITPEQRAATLEKVTGEWIAAKRFPDLQKAIAELHARAAEELEYL
ncbi:MAG: hypothetical protein M3O82_03220 [Verrucomicrobiota bacterium]|nr:hypothetical protein [Verrucomicrobiota bacterium]